jgi:ribosome-binding ATPase YchF (GTP1/OBG family)
MSTVDPVRDAKIIMNELKRKDLDIMEDIKNHMKVFLLSINNSHPNSF